MLATHLGVVMVTERHAEPDERNEHRVLGGSKLRLGTGH